MNKELFILVDYADLRSADTAFVKKCDRLAVTAGAMLAFEENGMSYLTFEDFYDYAKFRVDNSSLIEATESFLAALDKKYEGRLNFPRAFTASVYWFSITFTDFYYMSKICKKISDSYGDIYLAGDEGSLGDLNMGPEFYSEMLMFVQLKVVLKNKVRILNDLLSPKHVLIKKTYARHDTSGVRYLKLVKSVERRLKALSEKIRLFVSASARGNKGVIFIIQEGYEVSFLKNHMPKFLFTDPLAKMLSKMKDRHEQSPSFDEHEEIRRFSETWFPDCEKYIFEFFELYYKNVLKYIKPMAEAITEEFEVHMPKALFYSAGAGKVYEDIFAFIANKRNVPVFYFQHSGSQVFYRHPYLQRYFEQNEKIKKINIMQSSAELELLKGERKIDGEALGSIKLHDLFTNSPKNGRDNKKALYCSALFAFHAYKDMTMNIPDKEIFETQKEIIDIVRRSSIKMDIKVNPAQEDYYYEYFKELLKYRDAADVRVLRGFSAEEIIKDYGLLILDCVCTALVPALLVCDIPVIAYLKDASTLRKETENDLKKRFYIVRDADGFKKHLELYANNGLKSGFSTDIIDRYAFPMDAGDPALTIPDYIEKRIAQN